MKSMRDRWRRLSFEAKLAVIGVTAAVLVVPPAWLTLLSSHGGGSSAPAQSTASTLEPSTSMTPTTAGDSTTSETIETTTGSSLTESSNHKVPIADLCGVSDAVSAVCGEGYGGTIQVGSRLFSYRAKNRGFRSPEWGLVLHFPDNTCTKLVMNFAMDNRESKVASKANLRITQSREPVRTASTSHGTMGTLSTKLDGGPFDLEANSTEFAAVYVNGYAVCG